MKTGFVTIIGRTNAGKSTLLNKILKKKVSIATSKPQTTRNAIQGVYNDEDSQIIFVDTPGLVSPHHELDTFMKKEALNSLSGVDAVIYLLDSYLGFDEEVEREMKSRLKTLDVPLFIVLNKIDLATAPKMEKMKKEFLEYFNPTKLIEMTALNGFGIDEVISSVKEVLPDGEKYYPEGMLSNHPMSFLYSEIIREQLLLNLKHEVPHSCAVKIDKVERKTDTTHILATIIVDRDSQKGIVIGKNGEMIRKIGQSARLELQSILKRKVNEGVDVRIIYDDMGSHKTLKRRTKKAIINSGIKLQPFNRLVPIFNFALNLRNHRKIVIIDGKVSFTGGTNLADEYINEKRMHGYWKDCGVKINGPATDNFTISFLQEWQFLTNEKIDYNNYINIADKNESKELIIPFVSGPNYDHSIAQNIITSIISNAKEKLYIMTPYFIPNETITNLIINKAKSGIDVKIILPEIADKKFVYFVTRNNAEKLISSGVKIYTMNHSFVHSKLYLTETCSIIGSINLDLRSFNQQFESAILTNENQTLCDIEKDFNQTLNYCSQIKKENMNRNKKSFRLLAGIFNIISPFM